MTSHLEGWGPKKWSKKPIHIFRYIASCLDLMEDRCICNLSFSHAWNTLSVSHHSDHYHSSWQQQIQILSLSLLQCSTRMISGHQGVISLFCFVTTKRSKHLGPCDFSGEQAFKHSRNMEDEPITVLNAGQSASIYGDINRVNVSDQWPFSDQYQAKLETKCVLSC